MLGDVVRERRKALGWKQQALADKVGVRQSYISMIERGAVGDVSMGTLRDLAAALGVPVEVLLRGDVRAPEMQQRAPIAELVAVGWSETRIRELEELWPYQSPAEQAAFRREVQELLAEHRALEAALEAARHRKQAQAAKTDNGEPRPVSG